MKVSITSERCKECGLCRNFCPQKAITFAERTNLAGYHPAVIDDEKCIGCGICYTVCPDGVFHVHGSK